MTQEEKQLLLVDLCGRLPYETNGEITIHKSMDEDFTVSRVIDGKLYDRFVNLQDSWYDNIPCIKPYLRPMSSMTRKEESECKKISYTIQVTNVRDWYKFLIPNPIFVDWLNKHHFDFRGLISKGLAIEAPADMYKTE